MSLKNLRRFIWLPILLLCILFVTGFVLVHQLDLLLSLVGNIVGICSLILGAYFLYRGLKEYFADRRRNKQENPGQVIVRLPSSLTPYDFRIDGSSHTFHNQGLGEQPQARWRRGQIPLNKSIITGLGLLAPSIKFIEYYLDRSHNTFPPGFWYTPIGLIWAYLYLVITLFFSIVIAIALISSLRKRKNAAPENLQAVASGDINVYTKNASEARE